MRPLALLLFLLLACNAHAALPPEVQKLQISLAAAQQAQQQLTTKLEAQRTKNAARLQQQFRLTTLQLRLASWPEELLLTHAVLTGSPSPVTTLTQSLHQQTTAELHELQTSLATLTTLQQQASQQLAHLTALQAEFAGANTRLSRLEKSALTAARVGADTLASLLTQSLSGTTPASLPELPATSARLPVAGRLEVAYNATLPGGGQSEGLTFRAAPNSTVTALWPGEVIYAGPFRNLGGLVIIRSGNRHIVYGGLATLAVSAGGQVQNQTALGTLPAQAPARLYLEVRQRGHTVDPAPLLATN